MSTTMAQRVRAAAEHPLDWLGAILLSWMVPLGLAGHWWKLTYRISLLFWGVPILLLLPRFWARSRERRLRRAFIVTVSYVVIAGVVLDFILGSWILCFDKQGDYWLRLPSWSRATDFVPIEEVLFYILGAVAIILAYFWADQYWLQRYTVSDRDDRHLALIVFSPPAMITGIVLEIAGIVVGSVINHRLHIPLYYSFLVLAAFIPAIALYRSVGDFVNWRAFSVTALWVLLTSCIWEVTLALPHRWWGYQGHAMIGEYIDAWKFGELAYPIEALLVWIVVTFSAVLTFEAVKRYHADPRPSGEKLFGSR